MANRHRRKRASQAVSLRAIRLGAAPGMSRVEAICDQSSSLDRRDWLKRGVISGNRRKA